MKQMTINPPNAKKIAKELKIHGDTRTDDYFWMRLSDEQKKAEVADEQTKDVIDYIEAENSYHSASMKHTEGLQKVLYDEIVGRIKQKDESAPVLRNGYSYYVRYEEGEDYPYYCRKKDQPDSEEEVMLDGPAMGNEQAYFALGSYSVSPDNRLIVYGVDTVSRRQYTLFVKDLQTGEVMQEKILNTEGYGVWANDNKTFFYVKKDPQTLRSNRVYKHVLGTNPIQDELVYEEKDETFYTGISKTKSQKYLLIVSNQTLSSEVRFLDASNPSGVWRIVQTREKGLEYSISHFQDHFYIQTNYKAQNFRLMKTSVNKTEKENWTEVVSHREDVLLEGVDVFNDFLVLSERKDGLPHLRVSRWADNKEHYIQVQDPAYELYTTGNYDFNTSILRIGYSSLTTPNTIYAYDMKTKERTIIKQQEVLGGKFSPENYTSERFFITARDGVKVPVSIVYRNGIQKDGSSPLLLYGYGSYGYSMSATFRSTILSLLDRGFVYAIAHIRGGQEMGRDWYETGKMFKKKNTFYDFIDCAEALIAEKFTSPEHLYAMGGSAGGLLMGAVINMRPDLWNGVVAEVPFVDVVSTMLDETIPLTTGEFDEWGNPKNKDSYDYMKSYSPYDNVAEKEYPNLLINTGYWDSQVQYWEPLKWIAKLRDYNKGDSRLFFSCDMEVGHGGASGRFKRHKESAMIYAFLLDLEGIDK